MKLKESTVYVKHSPEIIFGIVPANKTFIIEEKTGYFHTKEQLMELITDSFNTGYDGGWCMAKENTDDDDTIYSSEDFIKTLFNTEEDEK